VVVGGCPVQRCHSAGDLEDLGGLVEAALVPAHEAADRRQVAEGRRPGDVFASARGDKK